MMGRATWSVLALVLLLGGAGCGGSGVDTGDNSVVVVHFDLTSGLPDLYQMEVHAHLGSGGNNSTLYFPSTSPIRSGDTLGLLISPTIKDSVDLVIYGLDGNGQRAAVGMGQVNSLKIGGRVDATITFTACGATGC